jgi:hypothetical protein
VKGNFFDRLAARALGLAPVSQPILPAKFSPAPGTSIQPQPFAVTSEVVEIQTATPPPLNTPQATPPRWTPIGDNPSAAIYEADSQRRQPSRQDVAPPEIRAHLPRESTLNPAAIKPVSTTLPQPEPSPPQTLRIPHESAIPATSKMTKQHDSSRPQAVTAQVVVRSAPESSAQDPVHHVSEQRANNSLQSGSEPGTLVVRVTIGRVEVRAQFPAAPSPQAPRRSRVSSLSLEDYLKQRSGGKR